MEVLMGSDIGVVVIYIGSQFFFISLWVFLYKGMGIFL